MSDADSLVYKALINTILQMDQSMTLRDIMKKLNETFVWEEIQTHRINNKLSLNKNWKTDLITQLMPKRFQHGGRRSQKGILVLL
jgi:hypothetical protein